MKLISQLLSLTFVCTLSISGTASAESATPTPTPPPCEAGNSTYCIRYGMKYSWKKTTQSPFPNATVAYVSSGKTHALNQTGSFYYSDIKTGLTSSSISKTNTTWSSPGGNGYTRHTYTVDGVLKTNQSYTDGPLGFFPDLVNMKGATSESAFNTTESFSCSTDEFVVAANALTTPICLKLSYSTMFDHVTLNPITGSYKFLASKFSEWGPSYSRTLCVKPGGQYNVNPDVTPPANSLASWTTLYQTLPRSSCGSGC